MGYRRLMNITRKLANDLVAGILLSGVFCALLIQQIMKGGVGNSITFSQFLHAPENIVFCLLMTSFIFASWTMRGPNNRAVIFCWAIGLVMHYAIYWAFCDYFLIQSKNIYALNFIGVISSIPIILLVYGRVRLCFTFCEKYRKVTLSKSQQHIVNVYITDFDHYMRLILKCAIYVELSYSIYLSLYGALNLIPYNGSIYEHILQLNHWDPFTLYHSVLGGLGICYILIIGFHLLRDNIKPDAFTYGVSRADRRKAVLRILEKDKKRAQKNKSNKRD